MTSAAARKAVRTMRENKEARHSHRYRTDYQRIMDTEMGHKSRRDERARRAVGHRHGTHASRSAAARNAARNR